MSEGQFTSNMRRDIYEHRHKLGFSFVLIFMFSLVALSSVGLIPEELPESERDAQITASVSNSRTPEGVSLLDTAIEAVDADTIPRRVVVESVGIDTNVLAPERADIDSLDEALLKGAVLYPGSGDLGAISNLFIFGHSSHLPVVNNQNFKAFNDLEKVKIGETIRVESNDMVNLYRVTAVKRVKAEVAYVALSHDRKMLTLSTCNSFGTPSDRFVVEAEFVNSYELARPTGATLTRSTF